MSERKSERFLPEVTGPCPGGDPPRSPPSGSTLVLRLDPPLDAGVLPTLAPVIAALLTGPAHPSVLVRLEHSRSARPVLLIGPLDTPTNLRQDAAAFLQALLEALNAAAISSRASPLPVFPGLVARQTDGDWIPAERFAFPDRRRTMLDGEFSGAPIRWSLQRVLLKAFALVEDELAHRLSAGEFDRLWNLAHGGLALPLDPPPLVLAAGIPAPDPPRDGGPGLPTTPPPTTPPPTTPPPTTPPPTTPPPTTPPPTTPPPTTPPPTTPPPTTPPPTTPPPTTPPPTTPPPTTPPPTTPPPTTPPPTTPPPTTPPPTTPPPPPAPPRIRNFAIDGHIAPTHRSLAGEALTLSWRVEGGPPLRVLLQRDGATIAPDLPAVGNRTESPGGSAKYTLRAFNSVAVVRRDIDLEVVRVPPGPLVIPPTPIGRRDLFGPSSAVIHPAAVAPGEGYFNLEIPASGGIPALTRGWRARVFYPATSPGPDTPLASTSPLPVVFFAPGRHHHPTSPDNHRGVTFLAHHLAGRGIIFVSVDLSQVDGFVTSNIAQRAALLEDAISKFLTLNSDPSSPFHNWFDLDRLALGGHSRGGETIVRVAQTNRARPPASRLGIRALFALAPTDFGQIAHEDEPLLILYGTWDADILIAQSMLLHDRADSWKKAVIINGANHFNWTDDQTVAIDLANISRPQSQAFAQGYVAAFLEHFQFEVPGHEFTLRRHRGIGEVDGIPYFGIFCDPRHLILQDFESPAPGSASGHPGTTLISAGGIFQLRHLPVFQHPKIINHQTVALFARHPGGAPPRFEHPLPPGVNYAEFTHLALRAFQEYDDALNPAGLDQDFSVELEDQNTQRASVPLSQDYALPPADVPTALLTRHFVKSILVSYRLPLSAFLAANPDLDLASLRLVHFAFDRTPTSAIVLDDLRFTY